jgi:WD40 repeat protein
MTTIHWRLRLLGLLALSACACGLFLQSSRAGEPSPEPPGGRIALANVVRLREKPSLDKDLHRIVWRPDGKQVAFVGWEKPVEICDARTFRVLNTIGAGRKLISFAFSRDTDVVALCENSQQAEVLNLRTKRTTQLDTGRDQASLAFSPDGKLLATGGYHNGAKLWTVATGKLVRSLDTGTVSGGLTVVFSPDGKVLAVGNRNSTTRLFEVKTGKLLHTLHGQMSQGLRFNPTGKTLAIAYVDGSVRLWDVASGRLLHEARQQAEVYTVDWSPRGDLLVTAGLTRTVTLWDTKALTAVKQFDAGEWMISTCFTPDGAKLLSAGGAQMRGGERKVRVWGVR